LYASPTDYVEDGWDVEQSARLASVPVERGVDLVDVSSDGLLSASIEVAPGYQVPFARSVREGGVKTAAVGMLVGPRQAYEILRRGTPT
jgi:hypothetical protein